MADLLSKGNDWLNAKTKSHMSHLVTYSRGVASVSLKATDGEDFSEQRDDYGMIVANRSRDFLIAAADLIISGSVVEPDRGDYITATENGKSVVYEVIAPGSEIHFRYSDPERKMLRIHTKQIGVT